MTLLSDYLLLERIAEKRLHVKMGFKLEDADKHWRNCRIPLLENKLRAQSLERTNLNCLVVHVIYHASHEICCDVVIPSNVAIRAKRVGEIGYCRHNTRCIGYVEI